MSNELPPPIGMVERVARALYAREAERSANVTKFVRNFNADARDDMEPFEECAETWLGDARAAIDAMREPTPEIVAAFWRVKNGWHFHDDPPPTDTSDYAAWRAAIDAALLPAPPVEKDK